MSARLKGKVVVITGSASGIGKAIAKAVSAEGGLVEGIDQADGPDTRRADVAKAADVQRVVSEIRGDRGRIDALVNCAGIWAPGTVVATPVETWERIFAVNVRGIYLISGAVISVMEASGSGAIVNIASNYGLVGGRNAAAYCASKGAVVSLTRAMALDHAATGIRVNCICPGTVETPLIQEPTRGLSEAELNTIEASRLARHPIGRIGVPEDVAPGVVYLISDEARFVTGAILAIDGGYTAQ